MVPRQDTRCPTRRTPGVLLSRTASVRLSRTPGVLLDRARFGRCGLRCVDGTGRMETQPVDLLLARPGPVHPLDDTLGDQLSHRAARRPHRAVRRAAILAPHGHGEQVVATEVHAARRAVVGLIQRGVRHPDQRAEGAIADVRPAGQSERDKTGTHQPRSAGARSNRAAWWPSGRFDQRTSVRACLPGVALPVAAGIVTRSQSAYNSS